MQIEVRLLCVELPPEETGGPLMLEDGATVEEALLQVGRTYPLSLSTELLLGAVCLRNNTPARRETPLQDGDVLTVIRTLEGG